MRQPRQRPISCKLCRSRKLRCDRRFPCSNCVGRSVPCEIGDSVPSPRYAAGANARPVSNEAAGDEGRAPAATPGAEEIQSRLERLEKLVESQGRELEKTKNAVNEKRVNSHAGRSPLSAARSPLARSQRSQSQNCHSPVPVHLQRFTDDAMKLEATCSAKDLTAQETIIADEITFQAQAMLSIPRQGCFVAQVDPAAGPGPQFVSAKRAIFLPLRDEARYITQRYFLEVTYFSHIIHSSTLAARIAGVYDALEDGTPPDKGTVLLLLALCANVCFTWTPSEDLACSFMNSRNANAQAGNWMKACLDMVDHVERIAYASLEAVQGIMVLFFVLFVAEGINRRGGDLMNRAITMAREIGLHHIDKPDTVCPFRPRPVMTQSEKEIGRRVMWYIAATDWSLGNFSMPQEGSYNVDPRHLHVARPANINDEDITDTRPIAERPPEEETSASYYLQRIRLAELCRDLFDFQLNAHIASPATPAAHAQYEQVLEIDARLHRFLTELPPFFSLDFSPPPPDEGIHGPFAGQVLRRCTIHLLVRRHLCKLHLPYLARGAIDRDFAYSRRVCLESARTIIRTEKQLSKETLPAMSLRTRMTMVLRCVFLASVALVLDACVVEESHDGGAGGEDGRRAAGGDGDETVAKKPSVAEIVEAWRVMKQAKSVSLTASRLLELSKLVLRRQNPSHPALAVFEREQQKQADHLPAQIGAQTEQTSHLQQLAGEMQMHLPPTPFAFLDHNVVPPAAPLPTVAQGQSELGFWNDQWMELEQSMGRDGIDWDQLFWQVHPPCL